MTAIPPSTDVRANEELAARVRIYLADRHFPTLRQLDVVALDRTIVLSGRVHTFHERQLAVVFCRRVAGVRHVVDRVVVSDCPLPHNLPSGQALACRGASGVLDSVSQ